MSNPKVVVTSEARELLAMLIDLFDESSELVKQMVEETDHRKAQEIGLKKQFLNSQIRGVAWRLSKEVRRPKLPLD